MSHPPISKVAEAISYLASGERLHAELGASSSHQWSVCTASIGMQRGRSRPSTEFSRWGTVNHYLSSHSLETGTEPRIYKEWIVFVREGRDHDEWIQWREDPRPPKSSFTYEMSIDQEHIDCATYYTDLVRGIAKSNNASLYAEIRVPIAHITDEYALDANGDFILDAKGRKIPARGTADCVIPIVHDRELVVADLKGGEGVKVDAYHVTDEEIDQDTGEIRVLKAVPNTQLAMYASGALRKFRKLGTDGVIVKWETVRLMIVQPRLDHVSEYVFTVQEIEDTCAWLSKKADETRVSPEFHPSYKVCQFCSASGDCVAQAQAVVRALDSDFEDVEDVPEETIVAPDQGSDRLDESYALIPFIRSWCDAVADRMHQRLASSGPTARFKLVAGNKGHRAWKNEDAFVSEFIDGVTITDDVAYTRKLITPAQLEKVLKQKKRHALWKEIAEEHIIQPPAKAVVAPIDDPRPPMTGSDDDIEDGGDDGTATGDVIDLDPLA